MKLESPEANCCSHSIGYRLFFYMLLSVVLLLIAGEYASAQPFRRLRPDSIPDIVPHANLGAGEFPIGAYLATWPRSDRVDSLWPFLNDLGINILIQGLRWRNVSGSSVQEQFMLQYDTLVSSAARRPDNLIVGEIEPISLAGHGQQVLFYPFDSVWSPWWPTVFTERNVGDSIIHMHPEQLGVTEIWYDSLNSSPSVPIASGVAYDFRPGQVYRYRPFPDTDWHPEDAKVQNADRFLEYRRSPGDRTNAYIVLEGHLFRNGGGSPDDALLRVEVVYEVPQGKRYVAADGEEETAAENLEMTYAVREVRKRDLMPPPGSPDDFNAFRRVSLPVDLRRCAGCPPGPLFPGNESRRFDLNIYWTGVERVALRSVALRDELGHLVLGEAPESREFRKGIVSTARRLLFGPEGNDSARAQAFFRVESGHEPHPSHAAAFNMVDSLIRTRVQADVPEEERIRAGIVDLHDRTVHLMNDLQSVHAEVSYMSSPEPVFARFLQTPLSGLPTLDIHNGGRGGLPLLDLKPENSREENLRNLEEYEETLQHGFFGWYAPEPPDWPANTLMLQIPLGRAAEVSRNTGRRLFVINGVNGYVEKVLNEIRLIPGTDSLESASFSWRLGHFIEPSEIRMTANLALAYGARGYQYWWIGADTNLLRNHRCFPNDTIAWGLQMDLGPVGPHTDDTLRNRVDLVVTNPELWANCRIPAGTLHDTLRDLYVGWQNRSREIRRLNRRLKKIGGEIVRRDIRWRDGYSVHYGTARPGTNDGEAERPLRRLPSDEIVTTVTARSPWRETSDPPYATYVDLGLFYTHPGDGGGDTNYVYVVNRRTFERPDQVDPASERGRLLDSLAETRVITLTLNPALGRSADGLPGEVRVREVVPDEAPVPLIGYRVPVDTLVVSGGSVELMLGPGRGALLEITEP